MEQHQDDWKDGKQSLPTTADYFELQRQHDKLQSELFDSRKQNASLFSQLEAVKKQVNDKQLEVEHCHAVCGELRDELTKAKEECERLRSLSVAAADLSIDVAQNGIEATKRIEELERQLATNEADVLDREADLIISAPSDAYFAGKGWAGAHARLAERIGSMMKARAALARAKAGA